MFFCRNVFVIIFGASCPGVRSIQNIAQWDVDFSCVSVSVSVSVSASYCIPQCVRLIAGVCTHYVVYKCHCVGIVKQSEPCDQSAVSEGRPLELLQKRSDTYPGSAPNLAALRLTPSSL